MALDLVDFKICPSCGSTYHELGYPPTRKRVCDNCGREIVTAVLSVVIEFDDIEERCPLCGRDETETLRIEEGALEYTVVYRCSACQELFGYQLSDEYEYWDLPVDAAYDTLVTMKKRQLRQLYHDAFNALLALGLDARLIRRAVRTVERWIDAQEPVMMNGRLTHLFAGALTVETDRQQEGPRLERIAQLAELFHVPRMTIKLWSNLIRSRTQCHPTNVS